MIARVILLIALISGAPAAGSDYTGDWRQACGDPLKWSDGQVLGPTGRVTAISESGILTIEDGRRVKFRLAGVKAPLSTHNRTQLRWALEESLRGRKVETLIYKREQDGTKAGVVQIGGRDIGLEMVLAGTVRYVHSDFLTAYDNCLYREGERVAREERRGIWRRET
jgi:endonuclease YncB( thermonuclease family)